MLKNKFYSIKFWPLILLLVGIANFFFVYNSRASNPNSLEFVKEKLYNKNFQDALEILLKYNYPEELELQYLHYLGYTYLYLNQYNKSIDVLDKAIEISGHKNDSLLSFIYNNQGLNYYNKGNYFFAIDYFQKSIILKEKFFETNSKTVLSSYINMAISLKRIGEYDEALIYYTKIENIHKLNKSNSKYATALFNKGNLLKTIGRIEEALVYYKSALDILIKFQDFSLISDVYNNLGNAYLNLRDFQKALIYYEKCINLRNNNNVFQDPATYNNLGLCYLRIGDFPNSEQSFKRAIEVYDDLYNHEHIGLVRVYSNLAELYFSQENHSKSQDYVNKAYQIANSTFGHSHFLTAKTLALKGELDLSQQEYQKALSRYDQALECFDHNELRPLGEELAYLNYVSRKAEILGQLFNQTETLDYLHQSLDLYSQAVNLVNRLNASYLNENNQLRFVESKNNIIAKGLDVAYQLYKHTSDFNYLNTAFQFSEMGKASVLNASLNEHRALVKADVPDSLIQFEKNLNAQILYHENTLYQDDGNMDHTIRENLLGLYREKEKLVNQFEDQYPDYYTSKYQPLPIDLKALQSRLDEPNIVIEYSLTNQHLFTFFVSRNELQMVKQDVDTSFFNDLFFIHNFVNYNSWITSNSAYFDQYKETSHELYRLLIQPFEDKLQDKSITFIPDAELNYIPFEILLTQQDQEIRNYGDLSYIIKDHPVHYQYSATTFLYFDSKEPFSNGKLMALAPDYQRSGIPLTEDVTRGNLDFLKGAIREIKSISRFFDTDKYTGKSATESIFKSLIKEYNMVHLAMHGILDEKNPMLSSLVFSEEGQGEDGYLNMYEIYNMNLNLEMLVLSACNTGFGDISKGEGIISFARSFVNAGCHSLIMTLWPINDETGSQIMENFYAFLAQGYSKDNALRLAKLEYLNSADPVKMHPYFWAGYVNVGDAEEISIPPAQSNNYAYLSILLIIMIPVGVFTFRKIRLSFS